MTKHVTFGIYQPLHRYGNWGANLLYKFDYQNFNFFSHFQQLNEIVQFLVRFEIKEN